MLNPHFNSHSTSKNHQCVSYRKGDWIIVRCTKCADYEKSYNWRTGEIRSRRGTFNIYQNSY